MRGVRKIILPLILFVVKSFSMAAQTPTELKANGDLILTQYWETPTLLNPASTGNTDFFRFRAAGRIERLGNYDAPKIFNIAIDAPFKVVGRNIGAGLIAQYSTEKYLKNVLIALQGSYHADLGRGKFNFGVRLGYRRINFAGDKINDTNILQDGEEDANGMMFSKKQKGNIDLGVGLGYDHPFFHIRVSGLNLLKADIKLSENQENNETTSYVIFSIPRGFYFDTGGNIELKNTLFTLQPSVLLMTDFHGFNSLVEMRATYNNKLTFGIDYRWKAAFGLMAGITLKNFFIGYAWEYVNVANAGGSAGNHELVLGYQFKLDRGKKVRYSRKSIRLM